jgi:hypothetical protein
MTSMNIIPLSGIPEIFNITLAGVGYTMQFLWRDCPSLGVGWYMDIGDANGVPILCGVPLVTGANLLEQYAYLGIGGGLMVYSAGDPDTPPTFYTLGDTSQLYWVTEP